MRRIAWLRMVVTGFAILLAGGLVGATAAVAQGVEVTGGWRYQNDGFGDDLTLSADGRAVSKQDPANTGRWQMEGDVLVIRWQNGWSNRYRIGAGSGPFTGTDIDPQGVAHAGGRFSRLGAPSKAQNCIDVGTRSLGGGLTEYVIHNHDCGTHRQTMPGHRYCGLTVVASGGFNSSCRISKDGRNWILMTIDPVPPDLPDFIGQSQNCAAICFD